MKKLIFLFSLFIAFQAVAQEGIRFRHCSWEEAKAMAKKEKKPIFIDFYTQWCGPCLNMAENIFTLGSVGNFYNDHFVCLKIDAETGEGVELAKKYEVASFPTFVFVGEFYQFNLSSCIRQQNSLTAQFVSFSLSNLANIFYPPQFLQ